MGDKVANTTGLDLYTDCYSIEDTVRLLNVVLIKSVLEIDHVNI